MAGREVNGLSVENWGRLRGGDLLAARRKWFGATVEDVARLDGGWSVKEVQAIEAARRVETHDTVRYQRVIEQLREVSERGRSEPTPPF